MQNVNILIKTIKSKHIKSPYQWARKWKTIKPIESWRNILIWVLQKWIWKEKLIHLSFEKLKQN